MKVLMSLLQLTKLLRSGQLYLRPAYMADGVMYYTHAVGESHTVDCIAEFNCSESVLIHDKPAVAAAQFLTAIHIVGDMETGFFPTFRYPDTQTMVTHDMRDVVNAVLRSLNRPVPREAVGDLHALSEAFMQGATVEDQHTHREVFQSFIDSNDKFIRMAWLATDIPNCDKLRTLVLQMPDPGNGEGVVQVATQHIFKKWTLTT